MASHDQLVEQDGGSTASADELISALTATDFVTIDVTPDVDPIAATGMTIRALEYWSIPYHVRIRRWPTRTRDTAVDGVHIGFGTVGQTISIDPAETPASQVVYRALTELDTEPDPIVAAAGLLGTDREPPDDIMSTAALDAEPGFATPTPDLADGLAHSTLLTGPFSGDIDRATAMVDGVGTDDATDVVALSSLVAVEVATTPRAVTRIERVLKPHPIPDRPATTVEGFADVLAATSREDPSTAIALAAGRDMFEQALTSWRSHARRTHAAIADASPARYDGLVIYRTESGPLETCARLLRDFVAAEPVVAAVDGDRAVLSTTDPDSIDIGRISAEFDGQVSWRRLSSTTTQLRAAGTDADGLVDVIRLGVAT